MWKTWLIVIVAALAPLGVAFADKADKVETEMIIDVRSPEEYAAGHADGAINIPYEHIVKGVLVAKGVNKDTPLVLYCRSGRRSALAADALKRAGYKRVTDAGSLEDFQSRRRR